MKRKEYERILNEVLISHVHIDCQTKKDILIAFKSKVIIEKHKVKEPVMFDCYTNIYERMKKEVISYIRRLPNGEREVFFGCEENKLRK